MRKIYVVSGKARHGKDTTCEIIKEIYEEENVKVINLAYGSYIKEYAKKISDWDGNEETKPRKLLQVLGTDIIRKKIDPDFFVKRLCEDIKVYSYFFDIITISDARFINEVVVPKEMFDDVVTVRIIREGFKGDLTTDELKHETEIALDNFNDYDYILKNDGTVADLKVKIKAMIEEVEHES